MPQSSGLRLAPAVRLEGLARGAHVLVCPTGHYHLNDAALAVLRLCDGSRNRVDIITQIARSLGHSPVFAIHRFLDVAQAHGWIIEVAA